MNRSELQLTIDYAVALDRLADAKADYAKRRAKIPAAARDKIHKAIDDGDTTQAAALIGAWVHGLDRTELTAAKEAVSLLHRTWRPVRSAFLAEAAGVAAPESVQAGKVV